MKTIITTSYQKDDGGREASGLKLRGRRDCVTRAIAIGTYGFVSDIFMAFIKNTGGRAAAGYKGSTGDCVVRALAILTSPKGASRQELGAHYEKCLRLCLAEAEANGTPSRSRHPGGLTGDEARRKGKVYGINRRALRRAYKKLGVVYLNTTELGRQYPETMAEIIGVDFIAGIGNHNAAFMGGDLHDTWDSRRIRIGERKGERNQTNAGQIWVRAVDHKRALANIAAHREEGARIDREIIRRKPHLAPQWLKDHNKAGALIGMEPLTLPLGEPACFWQLYDERQYEIDFPSLSHDAALIAKLNAAAADMARPACRQACPAAGKAL